MLETLDSVDWNSIHHAYGPARDVPDLLRAAVLADPDRVSNQTIELLTGEVPEKAVCVHTGSLSVLVTRCLARLPAERKNRAIQAVVNHYRRDLPMDALSLTRTVLEPRTFSTWSRFGLKAGRTQAGSP